MDKEQFLEKIKELGTCDDEVERRSILASVSDEVSKVYDANKELTETNTKYVEDMESLRQANMDLFKRIGRPNNTPNTVNNGIVEDNKEPVIEKSFSDFANDFLKK